MGGDARQAEVDYMPTVADVERNPPDGSHVPGKKLWEQMERIVSQGG